MVALLRRPCPAAPTLLAALLGLAPLAEARSASAQGYVAYPSPETLRDVQLAALACARENTSDTCTQARKLADPLMDHPRLPGGCKDTLWAIIQTATPASSNSLARRDAIGDPAGRLLLVCRNSEKPISGKTDTEKPQKEPSFFDRFFGRGGGDKN
ncbi:MAG: hypothetical protein ACKO6G_04430 [Vulcanococcus sp.]